jgi:hypothetical protein
MACQVLRGQDRIAVLLEAEDQKPSALSPLLKYVEEYQPSPSKLFLISEV